MKADSPFPTRIQYFIIELPLAALGVRRHGGEDKALNKALRAIRHLT